MKPRTTSSAAGCTGLLLALLAAACGDDEPASPLDASTPFDAQVTPDAGPPVDAQTPRPDAQLPSDAGLSFDAQVTQDAGQDPAALFYAHLRDCGLLTPTGNLPTNTEPGSPSERCLNDCFLAATCGELGAAVCSQQPTGGLATCGAACAVPCLGGTAHACDGKNDCDDGSDEAGCAPYYFACAGGGNTNIKYVCDGEPDCSDSSDEVGCSSFACGGGVPPVPTQFVCDFNDDCGNGADEQGCASYVCGG